MFSETPLLRYGSRGEAVEVLQTTLNQVTPTGLKRLTSDGVFGRRTLGRVMEFQRLEGLVADGWVGPNTWGNLRTLAAELAKSDPFDKNYRYPRPVALRVAAVYLPTFRLGNGIAHDNFRAARDFFKKYNFTLEVWPPNGARRVDNVLSQAVYNRPIPSERAAYRQLRTDVDHLLDRNANAPRDKGPMPVIFGEFEAGGAAITPHSTARFPHANPACIVSMAAKNASSDNLCIGHEMGHSAMYPVATEQEKWPGNLLNPISNPARDYLYKFQVIRFATASFAR